MMMKFDTEDKPRFSSDMTRGLSIDFRLHNRNDPVLGLKKGRPSVSLYVVTVGYICNGAC